jgi:hypothetical protein
VQTFLISLFVLLTSYLSVGCSQDFSPVEKYF